MTLGDVLRDHGPVSYIQWRCNSPDGDEEPDGIFCGGCSWTGTELISLDGDFYSLATPIYRYEWEDDGSLTYWEEVKWIGN